MSKSNKNLCAYELINIDDITEIPSEYPDEFKEFCLTNGLKPPKINTGNGKALAVMLKYPTCYWERETCDAFVKKFNIVTGDSIQLWNKHNQWGIQTSSGKEKGKYYIVYPYCLSNKHKMRKDFKYDGSEEEKNSEIDKINTDNQNKFNIDEILDKISESGIASLTIEERLDKIEKQLYDLNSWGSRLRDLEIKNATY